MPSLRSLLFRHLVRLGSLSNRANVDLARLRASMEKGSWFLSLSIPRGTGIEPVVAGGVPAEWLLPPAHDRESTLLFLHGGAFVMGSPRSHRGLAARIAAAARLRALVIDYRLAPEHPFPAALEDTLSAYRWLLREHCRPTEIVLAGDSAGGNLVLATLLALRAAGEALPAAAVCLSPATALDGKGESLRTHAERDPVLRAETIGPLVAAYVGGHDPAEPLLSPLYADLHGLPPLLLQVGSDEILLSDVVAFAERARQAGVAVELEVWEGMWHVWQIGVPWMPEAKQAIQHIAAFIRRRLAKQAQAA
ncbi:alpha/beta hydrolase [Thermogemmatispora sp.]|uniref:alpha/beta hydrolase n=1 Tax=Thermogemmatispora sp. TaxID=1968838 RepID=UPI0035E43E46